MSKRPIGFANGDGGTGRGANMVRSMIFGEFPMIEIPNTVEARLDTNDECIMDALQAFRRCGSGFKNSTASNDPRMIQRNMISANIKLRNEAGAFAILRELQGPGRYKEPCGVLRLATGGFYEEVSCETHDDIMTSTQNLRLDKLEAFATLAAEIAMFKHWHLALFSKSTIAKSERTFRETVERILKLNGIKEGSTNGREWTGHFHHELSDIGLASLSIETANGKTPYSQGRFLVVADNVMGDIASDIIDHQHGNYVMGSRIYCGTYSDSYTYEELSTGTAEALATGELRGNTFLSPAGIIFAFAAAIEKVNPDQRDFLNAVRRETLAYLAETPKANRDTVRMIGRIAERTTELVA